MTSWTGKGSHRKCFDHTIRESGQLREPCWPMRQDFKVLYMCGYTDNAIVHHGVLEKGINYLQKLFTVNTLARKVREVLEKNSTPTA
ncbi:MAG TPA: hypothetical protein VK568_07750 [Thermodesulfobacteriota bacterium]|nr:hypothetical protein [Thermodesulfobacteriota bacterium]